jgi:hypothetical protein
MGMKAIIKLIGLKTSLEKVHGAVLYKNGSGLNHSQTIEISLDFWPQNSS